MNILLITSRSDMGGGPRHVFDVVRELKKKAHHKVFVASPNTPPYGDYFKSHADRTFTLPHRKFSVIRFILLIFWSRKNNISTIHSHGRGAGIYSRLMKLFGFNVIHTFHGIHQCENLIDRLKYWVEEVLLLLTDKVVLIGEDEQRQFKNNFPNFKNRTFLIPNGIDCESFKNNLKPFDKIITNKIRLGVLARLDDHKGVDFIIRCMSRHIDKFHLYIAGDGPSKEFVSKLIIELNLNDSVTLLGQIDDPAAFISSIDILVSNSKSEGMPYSVLEALCLKKKILLSNVPGHFQFSNYATFFERNNGQSFYESLLSINLNGSATAPYEWNLAKMCNQLERDIYVSN